MNNPLEELTKALIEHGPEAIEGFLGYAPMHTPSVDELESMIRDAYEEKDEDELEDYFAEYDVAID